MFECTLPNGDLFKKIVAALSDLVEQGNFQVDNNMISFQGMDSSHVSLVNLQLLENGFNGYRCDADQCLGIQFSSLNKILKCMTAKDSLSIQARDDCDIINFIFESSDSKRYSNFELKLNDIDQEQLGIPQTEYDTTIKMKSNEFQRICRDLSAIGDTVTITANKEGIKFSVNGDIGAGDIALKGLIAAPKKKKKKEGDNSENTNNNNNESDQNDNNDDVKVKPEPTDNDETQMEEDDEDEDMKGNDNVNDNNDNGNQNENENNNEDEDDDIPVGNVDDGEDENLDDAVLIELEEPVQQTFSLRYLNNFTKATGLSPKVTLRMGAEVPLEVEYKIGDFGSLRYYLAPKIDDEE